MDVSLLRAALRADREGRRPNRALRLLLGLAGTPLAFLCAWQGWQQARALPQADPGSLGGAVLGGVAGLALASAVWDGTLSLRPQAYAPFLVSWRELFLLDLALALWAPARRALAGLVLCGGLGALAARPVLGLWLPLALGMLLLWGLCLERLAGLLTRAVGRFLRLGLLFIALVYGARLFLGEMAHTFLGGSARVHPVSGPLLPDWLPPVSVVRAWQGVLEGRVPWWHGLVGPLLWTALLVGVTGLLLRRDLSWETRSRSAAGRGSRSFRRPWAGVALQRWHAILQSKQGRFFLFMPALGLFMAVDPMLFRLEPGPTFLLGAMGWCLLPVGGMACDLFGLDRGGVRTFWLLPLEDRDLLLGKVAGTAAYQALMTGLILVSLAWGARLPGRLLPAVALFCVALSLAQLRAGLRHSLEHPRPLDPDGLNPSEFDDAHLLKLGRLLGPWLVLVATTFVGLRLGIWALTGLLAAACGGAALALRRELSRAEGRLDGCREVLTASLEGQVVNPWADPA